MKAKKMPEEEKRMPNSASRIPDRKELADFKRLMELCAAAPERREDFFGEPDGFLKERGLAVCGQTALEAIEFFFGKRKIQPMENHYLAELQRMIDAVHEDFAGVATPEKIVDLRFRAWYERKNAGYRFQSRMCRNKPGLFYIPIVYELSDGCSVGCPFCCLAAERLKANFPYTEQNGRLWQDILQISKELIGDVVGAAVCYFATEPFDNPGYEQFLTDFHRMFGRYPQTTTAVLQRDVGRTKKFLAMLGEDALREAALRGSIISLTQLERVHENFSSEELLYVELLMNNPESPYAYSKSGRSIRLSESRTDKNFLEKASSVCTCGFVVNLVKKTVMLISPHVPDETHPLGMTAYEERTFENAGEYRQVLLALMEKWMSLDMPQNKPLRIPDGVCCQRKGFRLKVQGDGISRTISLSDMEYECFLSLVKEDRTLQEIYEENQLMDFQRQQLTEKLQRLYDGGCLEEVTG